MSAERPQGVHRAKEIWQRITRKMDLWERDIHTGMVRDAEAEGSAKEGRYTRGGENKDKEKA